MIEHMKTLLQLKEKMFVIGLFILICFLRNLRKVTLLNFFMFHRIMIETLCFIKYCSQIGFHILTLSHQMISSKWILIMIIKKVNIYLHGKCVEFGQ